ncbi:prostaglandin E2 receptor EP4 subtype-like [Saccostrea cucullata]|uniref:prostaglandin E2 receptor EP4 subtype-like n=1 Tax=Saccostrea cuccullata TaxID=36930 RepID=UPI002ED14685
MIRNKTAYRILCEEREHENAIPVYIQMTLGGLGNILAIVLLLVSRHEHKFQSFYILFTGLVITDLINNAVCYPLILQRYISHFTWCLSYELCDFLSFLETFSHLASGMFICVMTMDRYLYIQRPPSEMAVNSRLKYIGVLCALLCITVAISILHVMGLGNSQLYYPGSWCFLDFTSKTLGNKVNALIYSVFGISIMIVTVIIGFKTVIMSCRNTEYQALLLDNNLVTGIYDTHVTKFLVISMFTFVFLWGPLLIDIFLHATNLTKGNNKKELWFIRLMYLNSQINPWLYVILRRESLRRIFLMMMQCRKLFSRNEEESRYEEVQSFASIEHE